MGLDDYFDKIFVINLKQDIHRRESFNNIAKLYNFKFSFIEAVDKNDLDLEALKNYKKIAYKGNQFYCNKKCSCKGIGHELSSAEVACQLSHLKVWEIIVKNRYYRSLIIEDDINFVDNFNEKFNSVLNYFPKKWNFIYFGKLKKINSSKEIIKINEGFAGTHMYAVSLEGAERAINNLFPLRAAADGYLSRFLISKKWGSAKLKKCYSLVDDLGLNGSQDGDFSSTISESTEEIYD